MSIRFVILFSYFMNTINTNVLKTERFNTSFDNTEVVPRVVNGQPIGLGVVPFLVSFRQPARSGFRRVLFKNFCGGTLITPSKIVTAAHCFTDGKACCGLGDWQITSLKRVFAVMGTLQTDSYYVKSTANRIDQWQKLKRVSIFPTYHFPTDDIAIAFTRQNFQLNNYVKTINYARKYIDYSGICMISGFGLINDVQRSDRLLKGYTLLYPENRCHKLFRKKMKKGLICTSVLPSDTGRGDSGGPLVCSGTKERGESPEFGILVGVVSGGVTNNFSFFTRVSHYHKFITNTTEAKKNMTLKYLLLVLSMAMFLFRTS